jgi:hypothetical protein
MLADICTITEEKLLSIMEFTLSRLARYDEGNPLGALLSMAPKPNTIFNKMKNLVGDSAAGPGLHSGQRSPSVHHHQQPLQQQNSAGGGAGGKEAHLGQSYVHFMRGSSETLQQVIVDELWVNRLLQV